MRHSLAVLFILVTAPAFAWGPTGHKIIASIAYRQLSLDEQRRVVDILQYHPRFEQDFRIKMPADLPDESKNEWLFQQAAVWPDMARAFKGKDRSAYHRAEWHYITIPHFLTEADKALDPDVNLFFDSDPDSTSNVMQAIRQARGDLSDSDRGERAVMLCWLFHCIGDIHQPLHSTALFSRKLFPKGDRGGNQVLTTQKGNLHSLWDGFPGTSTKFAFCRNRAIAAYGDEWAELRTSAALVRSAEEWLKESTQLAATVCYAGEVGKALEQQEATGDKVHPITLSEDYLKTGGELSERRVIQAGVRLGVALKLAI